MIGSRTLVVAVAAAFVWSSNARAVSVRPVVTISGGDVRLSDLFAGLSPTQDCVLGNGPAPGGRIIIATPQLQAIADQYGVDWSPGVGPRDVTLSRPGVALDEAAVIRKLGAALLPLGTKRDEAIVIGHWTEMLIDPAGRVSITDPAYDTVSGVFSANLVVDVGGTETARARLDGRVERLIHTVMPKRPMQEGEIVGTDDLVAEWIPDQGSSATLLRSENEAVGQMVVHALSPGRPVRSDDLRPPLLVRRGSIITVRLAANGVALTEEGQAVDTGSAGDRVRIMNMASRAIIIGVVDGQNDVTVDANSPPTIAVAPTGLPPMLTREASVGTSIPGFAP